MSTLIYNGHKISAEFRLYDWYDIDEQGRAVASQGQVIDAEAMSVAQWHIENIKTEREYWYDASYGLEQIKELIDKERLY